MPKIVNPADFIKVGLMAMVFIVMANMFLKKAGLTKFTLRGE